MVGTVFFHFTPEEHTTHNTQHTECILNPRGIRPSVSSHTGPRNTFRMPLSILPRSIFESK